MKQKKSSSVAVVAMFFATMLVIHVLTYTLFSLWPVPIKPTIVHIPVIIASIVYGPKIGTSLGFLMGVISLIHNTIIPSPTNYLFSPFVEGGNFNSLLIAFIPRLLLGITPYLVYKILKNRLGLFIAGSIGSITNTVFVIGGIFFLFSNVYSGNLQAMLATVIGANAIAELLISTFLTGIITPTLLKISNLKGNNNI